MSVVINGTTGITSSGGYTGDGLTVADGAPAGAVTVDSSGNLGLGVTPSAWGSGTKAMQIGQTGAIYCAGNVTSIGDNSFYNGTNNIYLTSEYATRYNQVSGVHQWFTAPSGTAGNPITFTQAMTLDASGTLLVGTSATLASGYRFHIYPASSAGGGIAWKNFDTGSSNPFSAFFNSSGTLIGSINCSNTATAFITSSDYRLKHDIAPMQNALQRVAALKPVTYKWNADDSDGEGFIAHELAEVCPQAVTGEKDAVDADGKPVYQGIDTSFLVATLTAAIQELNAKVEAQAAEIAALKGAV